MKESISSMVDINEKRFVSMGFLTHIEEEVPYDKCPRCGAYKFRRMRRGFYSRYVNSAHRYIYWHECSECKYREDE